MAINKLIRSPENKQFYRDLARKLQPDIYYIYLTFSNIPFMLLE